MATFVNTDTAGSVIGPPDFVQKALTVDPNTPIAPGETRALKLSMVSTLFHVERLIPFNDPQNQIAGLVTVQNTAGHLENITVITGVEGKVGAAVSY